MVPEKRLWLDVCIELSYGLLAKLTWFTLHTMLNHKLLLTNSSGCSHATYEAEPKQTVLRLRLVCGYLLCARF